jgi:hypothetical protein
MDISRRKSEVVCYSFKIILIFNFKTQQTKIAFVSLTEINLAILTIKIFNLICKALSCNLLIFQ